jgi:hypothetical protein
VRVDVAFTPAEEASARVGIAVDRGGLASGYERVLCGAEIDLRAGRSARRSPGAFTHDRKGS